jgi:hypothetical protein
MGTISAAEALRYKEDDSLVGFGPVSASTGACKARDWPSRVILSQSCPN